nr:tRNA (adenosine(37)-N6)-dimethylallyltransferase MiaA [uncultured Anaerobutyricum sp.]
MVVKQQEKKPLIILTGPTAAGKTSLSIELAKSIGGEIISADSMQVYKKMDIGTAKIRPEEMQGVPHYLIDELDPSEEFNVVAFVEKSKEAMKKIYAAGHIPIIVGGTGFYIQALLYDIDFSQHEDKESYRKELEQLAKEKGKEYLYEILKKKDPEYATITHCNNVKKVIRALEYYKETGKKLSEHNEEQRQKESPYNFAYFVLYHDREELYDRINRRVDLMMEDGLLFEVESLIKEGYTKNLVSMQGLGYKEFFDYFDGRMTLEDTVDKIKKDTRHFAKRQLTWFRREKEVIWLNKKEYEQEKDLLDSVLNIIQEKGIRNGTKR